MIGASILQAVSKGVLPDEYAVNLNPGAVRVVSSNGSTTTPKIKATVVGGVGPYEYQWEIDNEAISINTPTSESTSFTSGGFETSENGTATLTVTDKGNSDQQTQRTAQVGFVFSSF